VEARQIARYGWKPSPPDHRDLIADPSEIKVLDEVDPREYMTPIYDQLRLGSCTSQAVAAAVDYDRIINGEDPYFPSRLTIYALERLIEGAPLSADTGAYGRDGFKACRKFGMLPEQDYPYTDQAPAWQDNPLDDIARLGGLKLERPYKAVRRRLSDFKRVLSNQQTIAFGFSVYQSFETREVATTGLVPHPSQGERYLGGHEILAVGYLRDYPHHALCRNSWGTDWGMDGYLLMPWTMLLDKGISADFRTIYRPL
jgi:C1A family cysteine protease